MSYFVNQPITYTAVAQTQGLSDTFNYAWAFDDSTTGNVASLSKTWTTTGVHSATVTATDTTTGGTASAIKSVNVTDFWWTSSGLSIIPTASAGYDTPLGAQAKNLIVSGSLIVNVFDAYTPQTIVVFDGVAMSRVEYSGLLGTVGTPTAAFPLTNGPNTGKILVLGSGNGRYGFFDPTNGNFVTSPNTTPSLPYLMFGIESSYAVMGNGKILVVGTKSSGLPSCMIYDPVVDSWASASESVVFPGIVSLFTLPSGNVFAYKTQTSLTCIYNYQTDTWFAGPGIPGNPPVEGSDPIIKLDDGRLMLVTYSSAPVQATWKEGDPTFVLDSEGYPFTTQNGSATGCIYQEFVLTPDGVLINVGGFMGGSTYNTVSLLHLPDGGWTTPETLPTSGITYKKCFAAGRAWRSTNGILEYSSVWV